MMSSDSRNRLLQLLASLLTSFVFWGGVELLSTEFSWRYFAGGSMLTTLFLYAVQRGATPPIKLDKERG